MFPASSRTVCRRAFNSAARAWRTLASCFLSLMPGQRSLVREQYLGDCVIVSYEAMKEAGALQAELILR